MARSNSIRLGLFHCPAPDASQNALPRPAPELFSRTGPTIVIKKSNLRRQPGDIILRSMPRTFPGIQKKKNPTSIEVG
jgi:hypothetical protein